MSHIIYFTKSSAAQKSLIKSLKEKAPLKVKIVVIDPEDKKTRPAGSILVAMKRDISVYKLAKERGIVLLDERKEEIDTRKDVLKISPANRDIFHTMFMILNFSLQEMNQQKTREMSNFVDAFEKVTEMSRRELLAVHKTLEAHERAEEYSRLEHITRDKINQAEEILLEKQRLEKIDYENILKAKDNVASFSRSELMMKDKIIKAWEIFYNIVRHELIDLKRSFKAQEAALELSRNELMNNNETIKAMDQTAELGRQELVEAKSEFSAEEQALELSRMEMMSSIKNIEALSDQDIDGILENENFWKKLQESEKKNLIDLIRHLLRVILKKRVG